MKIEFIKSIYSIEKFNIYDNADVVINPYPDTQAHVFLANLVYLTACHSDLLKAKPHP